MDGLSTFTYKNKTIMYIDFSGVEKSKEKTLQLIQRGNEGYQKYPPKSAIALVNVKDLYFDMEILNSFKKGQELCTPYQKKVAIIGVKGLIKAAYNFVLGLTNPTTKAFESEQAAKDWLVSD